MLYNNKIFNRCFNHKGKHFFRNLKEVPTYLYLMHYLIKHGYDEYALWSTSDWFISVMKEIISWYKEKSTGVPYVLENSDLDVFSDEYSELNQKKWYDILSEMQELLNQMDPSVTDDDNEEEMIKAKNRFFELFSQNFYCFWD